MEDKPNIGVDTPRFRRGSRQGRYLSQAVILEESGNPVLVRAALYMVALIIVSFILWASYVEVDEVAVAYGQVVPAGQVQAIQHLEGGIIAEIPVSENDLVEKGDVLMRLDPTALMTDIAKARSRYASLRLQAERLRALGEGREPDFSFAGPEFADLVKDQTTVYRIQLDANETAKAVLRDQIAQRQEEINLIRAQEDSIAKTLTLLEEEAVLRRQLRQEGLTSRLQVLNIERDLNTIRGQQAVLKSEALRALKALNEVKNRLNDTDAKQRELVLSQMGTVTGQMAEQREIIARLEDQFTRLEIRAPVRGIVKGLLTTTVGGVVAPGATVLEVVPMDRELLVEARISTRDVGHVQIGMPVNVKVITYDFSRYGGIDGELIALSAASFLDEIGNPYFKGVVRLDRNFVGFDPERNRLLPGMTVQAEVLTGRKTLMQYLLKPVYTGLERSFQER